MNPDNKPQTAAVTALPEFADHQNCKTLYGLSRSHLYKLAEERKIRSVSIRKPGAIKGRRLFDCASIRKFLEGLAARADSQPSARRAPLATTGAPPAHIAASHYTAGSQPIKPKSKA